MIRIKESDRKELLSLVEKAVKAQVEVYNLLGQIEEITGHVTGLDTWVLREAGDWEGPEYVTLTPESLTYMLQEVRRED
jgi:hypothetical protein